MVGATLAVALEHSYKLYPMNLIANYYYN